MRRDGVHFTLDDSEPGAVRRAEAVVFVVPEDTPAHIRDLMIANNVFTLPDESEAGAGVDDIESGSPEEAVEGAGGVGGTGSNGSGKERDVFPSLEAAYAAALRIA